MVRSYKRRVATAIDKNLKGGETMADELQMKAADAGFDIIKIVVIAGAAVFVVGGTLIEFIAPLFV